MKKKVSILITILISLFLMVLTIYFYNPFLTLELIGESNLKININETYEELNAKASFLSSDLTDRIKIKSNVDTTKFGEYEVEYSLKYGIVYKKIIRKVIVTDLNEPVITLSGDNEYNLCGKPYVESGYKAIDNIDGDITDKVVVKKEEERIVYTVTDSSGNTTKAIRTLKKDLEKPEIKLNNSNILTFSLNSKYVEFGATATDNCDGDISKNIEIISNVDTYKHENFKVTYKVKDSSGNVASITRNIVIYTFDDLNKGYNEIVEGPTFIGGILVVNKKYSIPKTYNTYNEEASKMVAKLRSDALKLGIDLPMKSGNRSYEVQKELYARYKRKYGVSFADKRAARPGHSEHETGLAFDIGHVTEAFGNTKEGIWLKENCYKYGFIIRYPKYKEGITGYGYEPWHVRYVGVDIAKEIINKEITLEEYLGLYKVN